MKLDAVAVPCAACFSRFTHGQPRGRRRRHGGRRRRSGRPALHRRRQRLQPGRRLPRCASGSRRSRPRSRDRSTASRWPAYYGCLLTRPPKVTLAEDPEYPTHMDAVVKTLGCAAGRVGLQDRLLRRQPGALRAGHRRQAHEHDPPNARELRRQAIACACPLCQVNLDSRQVDIRKADPAGATADRLREPVRRPRVGIEATTRPQEGPDRRRGGDGLIVRANGP